MLSHFLMRSAFVFSLYFDKQLLLNVKGVSRLNIISRDSFIFLRFRLTQRLFI